MPTYRMIFIGNLSDMDAVETTGGVPDYNAENAVGIMRSQTFGSDSVPLYQDVLNVSLNETNGDGQIFLNNAPGTQENISYRLNGTNYTVEVDSTIRVRNVEIERLLPDGSTDTVTTTLRMFQDTTGNTFILPPPLSGGEPGEVDGVTTYPIVSISMPFGASNYVTSYSGVFTDRYNVSEFVPCFASGTMILTDDGERPVETLSVGDLVWTRDHGFQPLRWSGKRSLDAIDLAAMPKVMPIRIRAGALGPNNPDRDLTVSPQHRVLVRSAIAQRMFDASELLVAARQLTDVPGIEVLSDVQSVTYVHLLFDQHEVLMSNGAETESFYPGSQAIAALGDAAEEIFALFPQLRGMVDAVPGARPFATGKRARQMATRHVANARALVG